MEKVNPHRILPERSPSGFSPPSLLAERSSPSFAAERTRILLGCFRKGEAADAEVYVTAIAAMLSTYPEEIVRQVTDPVRGLPSKVNWLPTLAEIRHECETFMRPIRDAEKRTLEARRTQALLAAPAPATTEERERAYREYMERIRPGLKGEIAQTRAQAEEAAKKRLKELYHEGINQAGTLTLSAEAVELAKAKALARGEALA
jgi:hypothetical protein